MTTSQPPTVLPEVEPRANAEQSPQVPLGVTAGNRNVSPSSASVSSAGEGSGAGRKMRRTGAKVNVRPTPLQAPRWAASLLSSRPSSSSLAGTPSSTSKPRDAVASEPELPLLTAPSQVGILPIDSPEPARIVSDIIPEGSDSAIPLKLEKDTAPIAELLKQLPPANEVAGKKPSMAQSAKIQQLQQAWLESNGSSSSTGISASGSNDQSPAPKDWLAGECDPRPDLLWTLA